MSDRPPLPYDFREVRARLQRDLHRLLPALFGVGARIPGQGVFTPLNPTRGDRHPGSFVIWMGGEAAGGWTEYATGEKGDVIDLIAYVLRLRETIDAYWWALDFLGLERGLVRSANAAQRARETAERERAAALARQGAEDEARSRELFKLWLSLPPSIAGTPAETYLRQARGLPLERLGKLPGALRYGPALEGPPDPETGEIRVWRHVMLAAITKGSSCVALHRTFLKPDGSAKADMAKAKLMIGPARGGAIRLTPGSSKLSPNAAAKRGLTGPLAIGEGIETTLSVACARPDFRTWAAGSLSLMGLLEWPACASAVVLLQDHPKSEPEREAFARVEAHWRAQANGRPLKVITSKIGNDFNDWARAA